MLFNFLGPGPTGNSIFEAKPKTTSRLYYNRGLLFFGDLDEPKLSIFQTKPQTILRLDDVLFHFK